MQYTEQKSAKLMNSDKNLILSAVVMPMILMGLTPLSGFMPDTVVTNARTVHIGEVQDVSDTHITFMEEGAATTQVLPKTVLSKVVLEGGEVLLEVAPAVAVQQESLQSQQSGQIDFYYEGLDKCEEEANKYVGTTVGGAGTGFLFGLIGWGVGYAILASSPIEVPDQYIVNMSSVDRRQFIEGYRKCAKRARNRAWHIGAIPGALVAGIYVASMTQ
jgi:hypothetical protein